MGRLNIKTVLGEGWLVCPSCRIKPELKSDHDDDSFLVCSSCQQSFPLFKNIPLMLSHNSRDDDVKSDIRKFWGELYKEAYAVDAQLSSQDLDRRLRGVEKLFRHREHLAVTEMPLEELKGKRVLEIGPGAGAHSALFSSKGARMVAMDLTLDRVIATAAKLDMIQNNETNFCVQGDGERLPFADDSFDIVYSNGVLHHTPDTDKAIQEVFRVVKPGGKAIIMLYARHSFLYWGNLFPRAVLTGNAFKNRQWLGHSTEWMAKSRQKVLNPETKVYSAKELQHLFRKFTKVKLRKNSFHVQHIPFIGKPWAKLMSKRTGYNADGELLYGHSWRNESPWELKAGRYLGFCYNIMAEKI